MIRLLALLFGLSVLGYAAGPGVAAQAPVRDFRLPISGPDGQRTAFIQGDTVLYHSTTEFSVKQLHFTELSPQTGRPATVLVAEEAVVNLVNKTPVIHGDKSVRLIGQGIEASGADWTYTFDAHQKKLSLRRDVRVVLAAELKGLLQ